jgi:molybdopterin-binding protein
VSADTVRRLADSGELETRRTPGGQRLVDGVSLASFITEHTGLPEAGAIVGQSARNRFPGIITRVVKDAVAAKVEIQAGPHRVVSLMTSEAVDDLGLEPGMYAVAVVKATQVVVEVPTPA